MQAVAQAWLVLQLTGSPFKLGLISTLQFSPVLLFAVVTGAVADRLPKRRLLVITQTTLACQALMLGALVAPGVRDGPGRQGRRGERGRAELRRVQRRAHRGARGGGRRHRALRRGAGVLREQ